METETEKVRQGMRFTPHGIEDILRSETRIVVGDSERDSFGPLNLTKCYHTETDTGYKVAEEETKCRTN